MKSNHYFLIKRVVTKSIYISCLIIACNSLKSQRTLTVSGNNWIVTVPSLTEAGANYAGTYESAANQIPLGVSVPLLLGSGKVSVHYTASPTWHNSLILSAKRTGNGTTLCALCTITGGTTYQTLTQTDIELFRIEAVLALASYTNIPIQLQLSGVSVTIPAATYNSSVVFTVSAL